MDKKEIEINTNCKYCGKEIMPWQGYTTYDGYNKEYHVVCEMRKAKRRVRFAAAVMPILGITAITHILLTSLNEPMDKFLICAVLGGVPIVLPFFMLILSDWGIKKAISNDEERRIEQKGA